MTLTYFFTFIILATGSTKICQLTHDQGNQKTWQTKRINSEDIDQFGMYLLPVRHEDKEDKEDDNEET